MGATRKQNKNKHKALRFQFYLDPWNIILEREFDYLQLFGRHRSTYLIIFANLKYKTNKQTEMKITNAQPMITSTEQQKSGTSYVYRRHYRLRT